MLFFRKKAKPTLFMKGIFLTPLGKTRKLNAVHWHTPAGTVSPSHKHPEDQMGLVIKGAIRVTIGKQKAVLKAGDAYFIPSNVPHQFTLVKTSDVVDIFSPPRPAPKPVTARSGRK
ncbi:MAG: cupin domain-containing protein [Kiritimatiellae bacterium]|nr:cupin domain-containing protein [Kiritimatiellia bacterium]MDD5519736.1 cupin domain-containing protein [Kiritimatiellia bacterium]